MLVVAKGKYLLRQPLTWRNAGYELRTNTYRFDDTKPLPVIIEHHRAWVNSVGGNGEYPNDCRVISADIEAKYNELTAQIDGLLRQRHLLITDNFLTFDLLTPQDCTKVQDRTFRTLTEANKGLRDYKAHRKAEGKV